MKRLAALAAMKLSLYAKGRVDDAFFARYSRLISPDVTPEELASCPQDPDALAAALRRVTKEDVRQAAAAVTPDTVCTLEEDA